MIGLIKQLVFYGAIVVVVGGFLYLLRSFFHTSGLRALNRRKYRAACFYFTVSGYVFWMESSRVYRAYCQFRLHKIKYEDIRAKIESSKLAYKDEGYVLMKRVNKIDEQQRLGTHQTAPKPE